MIVRLNDKGSVPAELVKQNKKTVWVKVEKVLLGKTAEGTEVRTVTYKTIKRKLKDIVAE